MNEEQDTTSSTHKSPIRNEVSSGDKPTNEKGNDENNAVALSESNSSGINRKEEDNVDENKEENYNNNNQNKKRKRKNNRWNWTKKWKQKKRDCKNENDDNIDEKNNVNDEEGGGGDKKKNERKIKHGITWVDESKGVNIGSFAHPDMRRVYKDIHVDEIPSIKKASPTTDNKEDQTKTDTINTNGNDAVMKEAENNTNTDSSPPIDEAKIPKRKVALLIAFIGSKYNGMQMNKDQLTIQALIELAMYNSKLISPTNFGYPNKYSWSSSARTDKGVHSCAQVSSAKILTPTDNFDKIREMINEKLPDDIIILDVLRAARSFVAKTGRDKVRYQYMLPSFVLQDHKTMQSILHDVATSSNGENLKEWSTVSPDVITKLRNTLKTYRAPEETKEKLKDTLNRYCGTRKYHNYTSRKDSNDDSARRYIHSFDILDTVVDDHGVEWISTGVVGQSFLLHQIRKMISMAIDVARGATDIPERKAEGVDVMDESFTLKYMSINVAPAQGLFLEMSYFGNYNKKLIGKGDKLDWHSNPESAATLRWKDFKENKIMKHIMQEEQDQNNFLKYLFVQEIHKKQLKYKASEEKKHTVYKTNV